MANCSHSTPQWHLADCNEDGWHCSDCGHQFGFRPDFDREHTHEKVDSVLIWLHERDFIYVSNASEASGVVASIANHCRETDTYDQQTIIGLIASFGLTRHQAFWREQAKQFMCSHPSRSFVVSSNAFVCNACGHEVKQRPDTDLSLFSKEPF